LELYIDDVAMLKLNPSSVEVLVVSIVNGGSVDADLPSIFDMLLFRTYWSMMYDLFSC
jgi:hypothetical protein